MARINDWSKEALEALRQEPWSLKGPNAIVKVVGIRSAVNPARGGYFTLGKYLVGKTPARIVADLGLKARDFEGGIRVLRFTRLPQASEYEYELTAAYPGGLAYTSVSDPSYPPGSHKIHQWRIKDRMLIPVDLTNFLELRPGQAFPSSWL